MNITARRPDAAGRHGARHAATHEADRRAEKPEAGGKPDGGGKRTGAWWWISTIVSWLVLLIVLAVLLLMVIIPKATGSTAYTVLTGSMQPHIDPGALVVSKPTPAEDLHAGDVITFQPYSGNPELVTHRIIGIFYNSDGELRVRTQGDANNTPDDWMLQPAQIRGKVIYSVPQLGRLNILLNNGSRSLLVSIVAGGLILYAVWMIGSGLRDRVRGRRGNSEVGDSGDGSAEPLPVGAGGPAEPFPGAADDPARPHPRAGGESSETDVGQMGVPDPGQANAGQTDPEQTDPGQQARPAQRTDADAGRIGTEHHDT